MSATQTPAQPQTPPPSQTPAKSGRGRAFLIFFAVLLVLAVAGVFYWLHSRQFESTDDAQVDAHLNSVTSRVDGMITKVYVDDNQPVKAGDPLVDLDPRDFEVALDQAKSALLQARTMVIAQEPNIPITQTENATSLSTGEAEVANAGAALSAAESDRQTAAARLAEAEANNARAQADLARYKLLIAKEEVSQQEFDQIAATAKAQLAMVDASRAALASSEQTVAQRRAQLAQSQTRLNQVQRNAPRQMAIRSAMVASNRASAGSAAAEMQSAQLRLDYTRITAPVAGIVLKRSAEIGSHIAAGQQLLQIAQIGDMWVTANFKETQLYHMKPGQAVTIHVDALKTDFKGSIESMGGSTGAIASVLPPENATGNFVKVVQRIPVRIRFRPNQNLERLRPGMSVEPQVRIGD